MFTTSRAWIVLVDSSSTVQNLSLTIIPLSSNFQSQQQSDFLQNTLGSLYVLVRPKESKQHRCSWNYSASSKIPDAFVLCLHQQ
jgi:hypothetical protein